MGFMVHSLGVRVYGLFGLGLLVMDYDLRWRFRVLCLLGFICNLNDENSNSIFFFLLEFKIF